MNSPAHPLQHLNDAGSFIRLTDGFCHYRLDGPDHGPAVLMIHGATVPAWEFERLNPYLTEAGYRTLRADLFGHGYSDRPYADYRIDLFSRQMVELVQAVGLQGPVIIIGHSLGAAVAAHLTARHALQVAGLVLAGPLVDFTANLPVSRLIRWPMLGELLITAVVVPMLRRRRARRYGPIENGRYVTMFEQQLAHSGFDRALLSMFRCGTLDNQSALYAALADESAPVLLLRGEEDRIATSAQLDATRRILPRARYVEIPGAGHPFMLTHPERAAGPILEFLAACQVPGSQPKSG